MQTRTTETIRHELHRAEGKLAWKRETGQTASAKAFEAIVATLRDELEVAEISATCPDCGGDGFVEVRHAELDFASQSGEAWIAEPCICPAGQDWAAAVEGDDF